MNDLATMNVQQLQELQKNVAAEMEKRTNESFKKAREQISAIALSTGMSLRELMGSTGDQKGARKSSGPATVKYRSQDDASKTWTGRGRQPLWVKEWLAAGRAITDLSI
jgi:DNA-binding protein H-NS